MSDIKPAQLSFGSTVTPKHPTKPPVTPMSNSTMIEQTVYETAESKDDRDMFTTASDFNNLHVFLMTRIGAFLSI